MPVAHTADPQAELIPQLGWVSLENKIVVRAAVDKHEFAGVFKLSLILI